MGGGGTDGSRELVVAGRQVLYLFLKERSPVTLKPLAVHILGFAKLELPTVIVPKTEKCGDPVVRTLQSPMVEGGHCSQLLNELVIDAQ
jgi:hypothetical protein